MNRSFYVCHKGLILAALVFTSCSNTNAALAQANAEQSQRSTEESAMSTDLKFGTQAEELYMTKITVSDLVRSYKFYTEILGLKLVQSPALPMAGIPSPADNEKEFVELALNYTGSLREPMLILIKKRGVMPIPAQAAQTWLAFKVPDGPAVMSAAARAGIRPLRPYEPEKRMGFIPDPDGYTVEVLQLTSF